MLLLCRKAKCFRVHIGFISLKLMKSFYESEFEHIWKLGGHRKINYALVN